MNQFKRQKAKNELIGNIMVETKVLLANLELPGSESENNKWDYDVKCAHRIRLFIIALDLDVTKEELVEPGSVAAEMERRHNTGINEKRNNSLGKSTTEAVLAASR